MRFNNPFQKRYIPLYTMTFVWGGLTRLIQLELKKAKI